MSKNQNKQVTNRTNTAISDNTKQGGENDQLLKGATGAYQNNASGLFPGLSAGFGDIASTTGGYDPSILSGLNSKYQDFANYGGISPSDTAALQNQASQTARSSYQTGEDQLKRNISATGGYGFGASAINSLAAKGADASGTAINDINARIAGQKSSNQLAGLQGQAGLQQSQVNNRLSGLSGQQGIYNTNVAATQNSLEQIIKNFQVTGSLTAQDLQTLTALSKAQPNWWETVMQVANPIGGALSGIGTAIGGGAGTGIGKVGAGVSGLGG